MIRIQAYSISLFLLMSSFVVKGQDFAIGIQGGVSIPNLHAGSGEQNPLNTGYSSRLGPQFGLSAEKRFSTLFSLQVLAEYSSQGGKKDGFQAFPTPAEIAAQYPQGQAPTYLYANFKSDAKLNYLMVPVLGKFGWDLGKSPFRLYAATGPFVGFLLSAKQVTSGSGNFYADPSGVQQVTPSPQSLDNSQNIKDELHHTNFGAQGDVGIIYNIGRSAVFVEGGGNYGFVNIQKGSDNGKNITGAATVVVGYSIWLGKKL